MSDANPFSHLVPGFDFLSSLGKSAGMALPSVGQWVAPTLNPEELEKRIEELRTVQFWLEQNAKMLGATIQALEVQRMTLSTLKTMNVQMNDLRESLRINVPGESASTSQASTNAAPKADKPKKDAPADGAIDPMQWWSALTQQFTQLASAAIKDGATQIPGAPNVSSKVAPLAAKPAGAARKKPAARKRASPKP